MVDVYLNKDYIVKKHKIIGLQYYTEPACIGQNLAAAKITAFFKMIFSKRFYGNLSALMKKVKTIQKYWRMCLLTKRTRKQIIENSNKKIEVYHKLQK